MVGVVVVTHCHLAEEMICAAQLVVGEELKQFQPVSIDPKEGSEEIREKIMKIDGVQDALLVQVSGEKGRRMDLAALVVTSIDPGVLRQELSGLIEPYATPRRFIAVDKIPVTSTGKYDRYAIQRILGAEKDDKGADKLFET